MTSDHAVRFRRASITLFFVVAGGAMAWISSKPLALDVAVGVPDVAAWRLALVALAAFSAAIWLTAKVRSRIFWAAVFSLTLFLGTWYALLMLLPVGYALLAASAVTVAHFFLDRLWTHDLFYLTGLVGLGLSLGSWLSSEALLVGLVGLAVYDIVAAPPRRFILGFAESLLKQGIVPGLAIPGSLKGYFAPVGAGIRQADGVLLGAGDVAVPLILVAKAFGAGLLPGSLVLAGTIAGAWLTGSDSDLRPRPALPVLAIGCGLPFCLLFIFGLI
jgi:hypothetical protein